MASCRIWRYSLTVPAEAAAMIGNVKAQTGRSLLFRLVPKDPSARSEYESQSHV